MSTRSTPRLVSVLLAVLLVGSGASARADAPPAGPQPAESPSSARTDHLRVGALGGVGFPQPLAIEGFVLLERLVGVGLEYGVLPKLSIGDVEVRSWALAGDARFFPGRGAFFLGLRAGYQHLDASASASVASVTVSGTTEVNTWFVNPRLGFLWTWTPGISVGLDAGAQVPVSVAASSTLPAGVSSSVTTAAQSFGGTVLPTVNLRVGFLL